MFYESMKYADNTFVRFKNYMFWKQKKKKSEGIWRIIYCKTKKESLKG